MKITINVKPDRYTINIYDRHSRLATTSLRVFKNGLKTSDACGLIGQLRYAGYDDEYMLEAIDDLDMAVFDLMDSMTNDTFIWRKNK